MKDQDSPSPSGLESNLWVGTGGSMWNKTKEDGQGPGVQTAEPPVPGFNNFPAAPAASNASATRSNISAVPRSARLGSSLQIKGSISGAEDLQIDGIVDGPITLEGHGLTIGPSAQLNSQIEAREVVVYGKVTGNVLARDRVDVKTDGSVFGDISTARMSIEDGAQFKGRIEIDPTKAHRAN